MRDNPVGESDPAEGICTRCKKNSPSVLSNIGKMIREGCDRGSEFGTVHSGRDGKRVSLRPGPPSVGRILIVRLTLTIKQDKKQMPFLSL